jgi:hypothetical protein
MGLLAKFMSILRGLKPRINQQPDPFFSSFSAFCGGGIAIMLEILP